MTAPPQPESDNLFDLLGGRRGAIDASIPPLAFGLGWFFGGESIWAGVWAALLSGAVVAGVRLCRGDRPRSVLVGLLAVCVAALIAVRTGRAVDFFLIQVLSNAASALAWAVSIVVRWPLMGVVVGTLLGQRGRWRRDPALLRGYTQASWLWTGSYLLRLGVFLPLYFTDQVLALVAARVALSWPLIAALLAGSWWAIRRCLPPGHPGIRFPQVTPVTPPAAG